MNSKTVNSVKKKGVRFVRFQWTNNANMIREKAVHIDRVSQYAKRGIGATPAEQVVPVMYDVPVQNDLGLGPVGEVRLVPDWSTLNIIRE
ncbi:MAG: hypothetical protein ACE5DX_02625 [Candidatus Dojkabacteria bacterium]